MPKSVYFMRKDIYSAQEMQLAINFLETIFDNNNELFKKMLAQKEIYLEKKHFTYILHKKIKKKYRIMGNCIGDHIYISAILDIDAPDNDDIPITSENN